MRRLITGALVAGLVLAAPVLADEDWDAGVAAFKAGQHSDAAAAFARYVDKVPEAFQGHMMLGRALLKAGQSAKAATHLGKANELNAGQPSLQLLHGQALLAAGKARDACGVLGRIDAGKLPSANQTSLYQMRAKANCGGSGTADLKKVAESKNSGETWAAYGVAALNENEVGEAVAALDKAVQLSPNDAKIRKSHVSALVRQARTTRDSGRKQAVYNKAVSSARKYSEIDGSFSSKLTYGEVLLGAKKYNEAISALQAAAAKKPGDWLPNFYLGQAYTAIEDWGAAVAPLTRALGQTSAAADQKMINRQLGFTYEKQKNYPESIKYYELAGDSASLARVRENQQIARENAEADKFNEEREALLAEQERLKKELESVPTGGPPPR